MKGSDRHRGYGTGSSAERRHVSTRLTEKLKQVQEETQENFDSPEKEILDHNSSLPGL